MVTEILKLFLTVLFCVFNRLLDHITRDPMLIMLVFNLSSAMQF